MLNVAVWELKRRFSVVCLSGKISYPNMKNILKTPWVFSISISRTSFCPVPPTEKHSTKELPSHRQYFLLPKHLGDKWITSIPRMSKAHVANKHRRCPPGAPKADQRGIGDITWEIRLNQNTSTSSNDIKMVNIPFTMIQSIWPSSIWVLTNFFFIISYHLSKKHMKNQLIHCCISMCTDVIIPQPPDSVKNIALLVSYVTCECDHLAGPATSHGKPSLGYWETLHRAREQWRHLGQGGVGHLLNQVLLRHRVWWKPIH